MSCKSQCASLQLSAVLSYLLLSWHWNMCNKFLLAVFTFSLLATFLIRLKSEKNHIKFFLYRDHKKPHFSLALQEGTRAREWVKGTQHQRNTRITCRSCSLTFSALLLPFLTWPLLCCGMGMNVKLHFLPFHNSGCHSKAVSRRGAS